MYELKQIEKRLRKAILKKRIIALLAGTIALLSTTLIVWLLLSSIATVATLPVAVKIPLLTISIVVLLGAFIRYVIRPVRKSGDIIQTALQIEKNHPSIKGRLVAALQFREFDLQKTNFSQALINLTGKQAEELTANIDFNEIISGYPIYRKLRTAVIILLISLGVGLLVPGFFSNALDVYSQPTTVVAPPPKFSLVVSPGNAERVKYTDIKIGGTLIGAGFPDDISVFYRFADGRWQSEGVPIENPNRFSMEHGTQIDSLNFGVTLKQVRRSFDYYVVAGGITSPTYAVNIVERPRVTNLKLTITSPSYTKLPKTVVDENNGSFAAIVGSHAHLDIEANRAIDKGVLILDDSSRIPLECHEQKALANLQVNDDFSYHIRLYDRHGEENPNPIEYFVTAIPDEYPVIAVVSPGYDVNLDERMMIPFTLRISDDFGFSSLVLKYQIVSGGIKGQENVAVINFSDNIETEGEINFNWDVDVFNLLPSDYILYHFELADNDAVSGPKVTSTRVYAARLPSIDEIVMQTETQQEGRVFKAEKILQEQREMAERLRQLSQDMKSSEKMDWHKSKELQNIIDQQTATAENIEKLANEMDKSIKQLEQNDLVSEQILQKLRELQKLFNEVATPEMKEAMKKLAEAMKKMSQEDIEKAMKDFKLSQEEMLKRLERSVQLLKRMQIEQKMAAMLKMIREMLLEQNRVNVETEQAQSDKNNSQFAQRENNLQKQMKSVKEEARKLDSLLRDSAFKNSKKHSEFSEAVKKNQAATDMNRMEQELTQNKRKEALSSGEEASQKLNQLSQKMQKLMDEISGQQGKEMAENIRKAIDDANYLSNKQEDIYQTSNTGRNQFKILQQMAAEQNILEESVSGLTERVNELAKQSPFLAAEIRSYLEQAKRQMQGSCDNLGQRRGTAALNQQRDAIFNLNRASVSLLNGLENQKQCNKGGSCNKQKQKMQSLCQKQSKINKQTQGQCKNPGNKKLSTSQRQALQRLAGEQGAVRKSLEELQKEFGSRRDILGRLDALNKEIKKIEESLEEGNVGDDVIKRQLQVYSRMLDVQKSLNRRDYTRERQAVSAEDIFRASPGALDDAGMNTTETLQDKLNRYMREGYPRQYEKQIKAYFKAISRLGQDAGAHEN